MGAREDKELPSTLVDPILARILREALEAVASKLCPDCRARVLAGIGKLPTEEENPCTAPASSKSPTASRSG